MKNLSVLLSLFVSSLIAAVVGFYFGYFGAAFHFVPPVSTSDWATWAGTIGTVSAVVVAAFAVYFQNQSSQSLERTRRDQEESGSVLALCYLGREIRQMCTLARFQVRAQGNPIIYPDIGADFASMAAMISALPIAHISARGLVEHSLALRRVAIQMEILYRTNPQQGDGFSIVNRADLEDLQSRSLDLSIAVNEALKNSFPNLYAQHRDALSRL